MKIRNPKKKQNVILDLDETLIKCISYDDIRQIIKKYRLKYSVEDVIYFLKTNFIIKEFTLDHTKHVIIARPYLFEFLKYLSMKYNLSVFTLGTRDYATRIVNFLLNSGIEGVEFDFMLTRGDDNSSKKIYGSDTTKDLRYIWDSLKVKGYSKRNTLILDDNRLVFKTNPENTIPIKEFRPIKSGKIRTNDKELLKSIKKIKKWFDKR